MSVSQLCPLLGVSRQAYYDFFRTQTQQVFQADILIQEVVRIRAILPHLGTRKLFYKLDEFMQKHQFNMGRDRFFDLLSEHHLLIRRRRSRKPKTTFSSHWLKKYPNLIVDLVIDRPNQVWVSDITYIVIGSGFAGPPVRLPVFTD